jgi:3-hydroxyisobutyryl-CoA hydrolase
VPPTTSPVSMARLERILHLRGLRCWAVPSCAPFLCLIAKNVSPDLSSEHGLATHYVPSSRVSILLESLAALENPTYAQINEAIEDLHHDKEPADPVAPLTGAKRVALDSAFSRNTVEDIVTTLQKIETSDAGVDVVHWAKDTLATLEERSPTSLKIALIAIRKGASLGLLESLKMELDIAAAFCVSFF